MVVVIMNWGSFYGFNILYNKEILLRSYNFIQFIEQ